MIGTYHRTFRIAAHISISVALAFSASACRRRSLDELPDRTGLDIENRHHIAFNGFFNAIGHNVQSKNNNLEVVGVYHYNNYLQRLDMPQESVVIYLNFNESTNIAAFKCWVFPNNATDAQVFEKMSQGPDTLSQAYPHRAGTIPLTEQPTSKPTITPERAENLYQKTLKNLATSKEHKFTPDETSNGEWFGFRTASNTGVISKYDLERYAETQTTHCLDRLLNLAYSHFPKPPSPAT